MSGASARCQQLFLMFASAAARSAGKAPLTVITHLGSPGSTVALPDAMRSLLLIALAASLLAGGARALVPDHRLFVQQAAVSGPPWLPG